MKHHPCLTPIALFFALMQILNGADNFSDAAVLTGASATATESSQTATVEAGEPKYSSNNTSYRSLWWKWRAPSNGRAVVDLTGSATVPVGGSLAFGKYVGVYVPKSAPVTVASLARVVFDGGSTTALPGVQFPVAANTNYYFHVCSYYSADYGSIRINVNLDTSTDINQLNLQPGGLATNDAFADRTVLSGATASSIAYNDSATHEPSIIEPDNGYRTMWWQWTAPSHGRVTIAATGSDATVPRRLSVFLGNSLTALRLIGTAGGSTASAYAPSLSLPVTAGQTYQISLGNYSNSTGASLVISAILDSNTDINGLNVASLASVTNDLFANRVVLTPSSGASVISYGAYAGLEALEPAAAGYGTMWWTYTAPAAGTVNLSTTGSNTTIAKYLTVWTGGALGSLTQVARAGSSTNELPSLSFSAVANQTYQISVGAHSSANAAGTVVLTLGGPPGPQDAAVEGLVIDHAVRLRWPTVNSASYRLRSSNDLRTWTNLGEVIMGDGSVMQLFQPVTRAAQYFRVVPQ